MFILAFPTVIWKSRHFDLNRKENRYVTFILALAAKLHSFIDEWAFV